MNYISKLSEEQILRLLHRIIHILYFTIPLTLLLMCCSCSTTKYIPQIVEHTARDTLYIGSTQYDSIYRNDSFVMDYHPSKEFIYLLDSILIMKVDTMYIRDKNVEYKYKYLHDTTYIHRIDSIPVIRTVTERVEVKYTPWYTKALGWVGAIAILIILIYIFIKIKL